MTIGVRMHIKPVARRDFVRRARLVSCAAAVGPSSQVVSFSRWLTSSLSVPFGYALVAKSWETTLDVTWAEMWWNDTSFRVIVPWCCLASERTMAFHRPPYSSDLTSVVVYVAYHDETTVRGSRQRTSID